MKFKIIVFTAVLIPVINSCVTQKKKDDVGAIGKLYHNTTAKYNGYFNANVLLEESFTALNQQYQDNYNQILPVYKYVEAENPQAEAEKLNNAIKKVSVVINLHRVSQWTDDCYLLIGKAQYLKKDYEAALETLEFMAAEFAPQEIAKREAQAKTVKKKAGGAKPSPSAKTSTTSESKKEATLTKKEREKLAAKERKEREKLAAKEKKEREKARKQKIQESKKRKKSGKPAPKTSKTALPEEKKPVPIPEKTPDKVQEKKLAEQPAKPSEDNTLPEPGSISLGDMQPSVADSDPDSYFLKHRPAHQEGLLWLARTYIERENLVNAERLLLQLERSPSTFKDVRSETAIAKSYFFLKQKKYDAAIDPLQSAIQITDDIATKARLSFILGQIHSRNGNSQSAYAAFENVLKYQPVFEMEFRAKLNMATSGVTSAEESARQLERMLKEEKNKEYTDQIYFALAQLSLKGGDKNEAIKNLELSLRSSTQNVNQKAESFLQLADLYFDNQNFVKAKLYYDSTLLVLSNTDERFKRVNLLASNLDGIATNIQTITLQDSLLRISRMTDAERKALAISIKKKQTEERLVAIRVQAQTSTTSTASSGPSFQSAGGNKSSFFAYNDRTVKSGIKEFERKWGNRTLEDYWRYSNRKTMSGENKVAEVEAQVIENLTQEDVSAILQGVPETPEQIAYANRLIETSLFSLGSLYRERLQNYPKAIEALTQLLDRFPETQYQLDALYYLYLSYKETGDRANADKYQNLIINRFPGTNYARIIQDPNYFKTVSEQKNKLTSYYDETFALFQNRQYQAAYARISQVPTIFGASNPLQPRFALLSAMCVGSLSGKESYVDALQDIVAKFPDQPEATRAKEILRLLGEVAASGPGQQRNLPPADNQYGSYQLNDDKLHYVIIVFKNEISLNDAKIAVTEYNNKYHSLDNLRLNNIYLGDGDTKLPIIAMRRYLTKKEAMDYYNGILKNKKDFLDPAKYEYEVFPIEQDNYRELLKLKEIDQYRNFFRAFYLK